MHANEEQVWDLARMSRDSDAIFRLLGRIERGERLILDDTTQELLRRVGEDIALDAPHVTERLTTEEGATALLREEWARIRDGSNAVMDLLRTSSKLRQQRRFAEAVPLLEDYIKRERVPWHRELARRELEAVKRRDIPPYRPVRAFFIRLYAHVLVTLVFPVTRRVRRWMGKPEIPGIDE